MAISSKTVMPTTFKGISGNFELAASAVCANGCYIAVLPVWAQSKGKSRKCLHHIVIFIMQLLLLGRSQSGVGAGVVVDTFRPGSESGPESLENRRFRSSDTNALFASPHPR